MEHNTKSVKHMLSVAVAVGLLSASSYAQAASVDNTNPVSPNRPTAGSTMSDLNQKNPAGVKLPGVGSVDVKEAERPALNLPNELRVQVNDFKITGQTIYPEEKLKAMISTSKGKMMTFGDLQKDADKLTNFFKDQGYVVARVYLPTQKIANGVVEYAVTVGQFDGIKVENNTNIHDTVVQQQIEFLKKGSYIKKQDIERAVWLLTDLAGADAKMTISQGSEPGTSNLLIKLNPYSGKNGLFYIDNYGNRSTGYNEFGISYDFLNPVHEGDHLALDFVTTGKNLNNGSFNYTIPVWKDGLTANIGMSRLGYSLGDTYSALDAVGTANVYHLGFDYAIQRSQRHNLYTGLRAEHSVLKDEYRLYGLTYSDKQSNAVIASLYGNEQDAKGATNWRVDYKFGTLGFGAHYYTHQYFDAANTEGNYSKLSANILRRQSINDRLYLLLSARGQFASRNLDSSERMSLGGVNGVRAYPQGEASGDVGYSARAELRWLLPLKKQDQSLQLATYLDHGAVRINKSSSSDDNYRKLQGMGIGLIWSRKDDWFLRTDYAWRLGAERPASDTTFGNGHFWIQGGVYF